MTSSSPTLKTVLIFHGSSDVQERFCGALKEAGHKAVSVTTRSSLLECMQQNVETIDLFLLDLSLTKLPDKTIQESIESIGVDGSSTLIFSGSLASAREIMSTTREPFLLDPQHHHDISTSDSSLEMIVRLDA